MIQDEKILLYAKSYLKQGLEGIDKTVEKIHGEAPESLINLKAKIQDEIRDIEEMESKLK